MEVTLDALILVATAAPEKRETLVRPLTSAGYEVLTAANASDCLRLARERSPDSVLIDPPLPDLDVLELCRRLRSSPATASSSLLIVSGNGSRASGSPTRTEALAAGAYELVVRPFGDRELLAEVGAAVRVRRAELASQQALGRSEMRFRALFEKNPLPMWLYDCDSLRILEVNEAAVIHYGYSRPDFLSMGIEDLFDPEERPHLLRMFQERHPCATSTAEWRHLRKDGRRIDVEITWHEIQEDGVRRAAVVAYDVTARKRANETCSLLSSIVESSNDAIIGKTLDGVIVSWNSGAAELYGYAGEEMIGRPVALLEPPDREGETSAIIERLCRGEQVRRFETERVCKDGRRISVSLSVSPIYDAEGWIQGASAIARDITDLVASRKALQESEERYRELFENANDLIYTSDLQGNFTSVSKAAERITGYTREEILSKNLSDVVRPEYLEASSEMLEGKLEGQESTFYDLEIVAKDGRHIALEMNARLIYQEGKPVAVEGIGRDVTERRKLEQQFRTAQKMEAVGLLAGGIAHDFNNVLSVIIGRGELILDAADLPLDLRTSIEEILKAGKRAAALTRQLLAFSRRQVMEPKIVDLNVVVAEMESLLRRLMGENVELVASLEPRLGSVKADLGQIEQVIMNLAVNARDAMPEGGKLIISTSNVDRDGSYPGQSRAQQAGPYVMLAVSDTGTGMPPEVLQRVFEPFFTTKEKGKGTGLGLATVYGIVKQSGGYVWVYSEPGLGSTFKVYLPCIEPAVEPVSPVRIAPDLPCGSETVLLVEDEPGLRQVARQFLAHCGYRTLEAGDAEEALRLARGYGGTIHLLLTDVVLPHMSGPQMAQRLRTEIPGLEVLYMSGYADDAVTDHGVIEPGAAFLQKPFTRSTLARKLREVLGKTAGQENQASPAPNEPGL